LKEEITRKYNLGIPQDDQFIKNIILDKISKNDRSVVFDNYPFSTNQTDNFLEILSEKGVDQYLLINIKIKKETAINRISHRVICPKCGESYIDYKAKDVCEKCGEKLIHRTDDNRDVVAKRVDGYLPRIEEVSEAFKKMDKYIEIDGEKTPEEVKEEINSKLAKWNI
ncbi:MAG: adenylate kinase family protein, partial [Candidatus Njordarchaeales archaeon]